MNDKVSLLVQNLKGAGHYFFHQQRFPKGNRLLIDGKVKLIYGKQAEFILNGSLVLGHNSQGNNGRSTVVRLDDGAQFIVNGDARFFYGGDIYLFEKAQLIIGDSYINSDCVIRATKEIIIGDGCAIGCHFTVLDSNFHEINGKMKSAPVTIEDNVWIGANVTILPGVVVGRGSVIAAGSVVTKSVPPNSLVAGVPAKVIKEQINWRM